MSAFITYVDNETPQDTQRRRGRANWRIIQAERLNRALARQARSRAKYHARCRPETITEIASIRGDGTPGRPTERRREYPWGPPVPPSMLAQAADLVALPMLVRKITNVFKPFRRKAN